jgi:hypothetical protein
MFILLFARLSDFSAEITQDTDSGVSNRLATSRIVAFFQAPPENSIPFALFQAFFLDFPYFFGLTMLFSTYQCFLNPFL